MLSTYRPGTSVMTIGHLRGTKTINRTGETIVAKPERCLTPVIGLGPESDATARCDPAGPSGALLRGGLTDRFDEEHVDAATGVVAMNSSETRVDHVTHPFDGDGGFGDVGGDDYLATVTGGLRHPVAVAADCREVERRPAARLRKHDVGLCASPRSNAESHRLPA